METAIRIDAVRPWRTATVVASTVAAVELAVLLVLAFGVVAKPVAESARAAAERKAFAPAQAAAPVSTEPAVGAPPAKPVLARADTSVLVLNGNGRSGAAGEAGRRVRALGYALGGVGNAPRSDYRRTLVLYRPGREAEARRLARDLKLKVVAPLDGLRPADLLGAHVAVVLGAS